MMRLLKRQFNPKANQYRASNSFNHRLCSRLLHEYDGFYVRIVAFVVDSHYRRRGIGEKLLLETERWAREQGAIAMGLNSGNRSERLGAHRFYAKMGYEPKSIGFSKRLV